MARTKRVPGYLLHKASGQARVVLNGKSHYLGEYGSEESRREYDRVWDEGAIKRRGEELLRRACKIWPKPVRTS